MGVTTPTTGTVGGAVHVAAEATVAALRPDDPTPAISPISPTSRPRRPPDLADLESTDVLPYGPPDTQPRRLPLVAAVLIGAAGVASLPTVLAYPGAVIGYLLTLGGPLAVAAVGVALPVRWLRNVGLVATVAGAGAAAAGLGAVLVLLLVATPLAVVVVVGDALRRVDPTAPTPLLAGSAIAVAGGFAAAALSPPIVVGVTVLLLVGGAVTTVIRLTDRPTPIG